MAATCEHLQTSGRPGTPPARRRADMAYHAGWGVVGTGLPEKRDRQDEGRLVRMESPRLTNRRDFLRLTALGSASAFLAAACAPAASTPAPAAAAPTTAPAAAAKPTTAPAAAAAAGATPTPIGGGKF